MRIGSTGADGNYLPIVDWYCITGEASVSLPGGEETGKQWHENEQKGVAHTDRNQTTNRMMGGAAAQEAQRGRERFAGLGAGDTSEQEALLSQARTKAAAEAAAEEEAAVFAAAAAAAAKRPAAKKPKKAGGGGFLGSLKQQAAKTKEKQDRHRHSSLDDVAKQGAAFTPVHYQQ